MKLKSFLKFISDSDYRFLKLAQKGRYNDISDEEYIKRKWKALMGYELNLDNPQSINEKLQWLKLHDRKEIYTTLVDKCEVKKYIISTIGDKYIVPTIGEWETASDIDFDALPKKFVLKCNHDSGGVVICNNKDELDKEATISFLNEKLSVNYFYRGREWCYKNVKPKILAEQMLDSKGEELLDYKVCCFNGKAKCTMVCSERNSKSGLKVTFYDLDWNKMDMEWKFKNSDHPMKKPDVYSDMIRIAEELSRDIPFARIDFYDAAGRLYFGEITLYPVSGIGKITPKEWDYTLGSWIDLSEVREQKNGKK